VPLEALKLLGLNVYWPPAKTSTFICEAVLGGALGKVAGLLEVVVGVEPPPYCALTRTGKRDATSAVTNMVLTKEIRKVKEKRRC